MSVSSLSHALPAHVLAPVEAQAHQEGKHDYLRLHRYRYAALLSALAAAPADVLEVGTTPGQFTHLLVGAGYRVCGVDLDPSGRAALWARLGADVRQADLEREPVPFADQSVDMVVFSEVIEHLVYSPLPVLRELRRVLRPGGHLILSTPNELYAKSRLRTLLRVLLWQSLHTSAEFRHQMRLEGTARYTTHSRTYTMAELCWLLREAGFDLAAHHYVAAWEPVGLEQGRFWQHPLRVASKQAVATLTHVLPPLRSMLLVVGQKP